MRGCPGANDNGSGVAAMLEISRHFATLAPALTVRFVAFVNEEPPSFFTAQQGSAVYAKAARERGDDIRLMVSLETLGCYFDEPGSQRYPPLFRYFFPDRGNFLGLVSDFRSGRVMRRMARTFRRHSDFPLEHVAAFRWIPGIAWSDHLSFWRQGYRCAHGHRHGILPLSLLPHARGHPGQADLSGLRPRDRRSLAMLRGHGGRGAVSHVPPRHETSRAG